MAQPSAKTGGRNRGGGAGGVSGAGFFLTHVMECPLEGGESLGPEAQAALKERLAAVGTRIRRSLKPKRVMVVTEELTPIVEDILALDLGCPVLLDRGKPFRLESGAGEKCVERVREALAAPKAG